MLLILAILAGLGVTSVLYLTQQQAIHRDTRRVRSALVQARSLARTTRRCVKVTLGAHRLELTPYETCSPKPVDPDETTTWELVPTVSLSAFDNGESVLVFNEQGGLDLDGPVELPVTTTRGNLAYRIYPAIGAVRMVER